MAHRHRPAAALIALLALGSPVAAQSPEPALPRVIYGQTEPQVLYGPSSPAPAPPPPRLAIPQAATAPPPPQPSGTSLSYGWVPAGPPVWYGPPGWNQPPGWQGPPQPGWGTRAPPPIDNRYERPLPPGRYVGTPPGAPADPRRGFDRR